MKILDLIRYITQHPEYTNIVIKAEDDMTPMTAICYLASIDPSYYDTWRFAIKSDCLAGEKTLLIYDEIKNN